MSRPRSFSRGLIVCFTRFPILSFPFGYYGLLDLIGATVYIEGQVDHTYNSKGEHGLTQNNALEEQRTHYYAPYMHVPGAFLPYYPMHMIK